MKQPKIPAEFQHWLNARALTVVPVAAAELLNAAIDTRLELDSLRNELRVLAGRESDTPLGDLMRLRDHEADLLLEVHDEASALIAALRRGGQGDDEYRSWRQAVGRYERRTA